MKPRGRHALYLWPLVALALRAAPAGAQEKLPVLEPVEVRGYQGDEGQGLRLTFKVSFRQACVSGGQAIG